MAETILMLFEMAIVEDCKKGHKFFPSLNPRPLTYNSACPPILTLGSAMWFVLANGILPNGMQAKAWKVLVLFLFLLETFSASVWMSRG